MIHDFNKAIPSGNMNNGPSWPIMYHFSPKKTPIALLNCQRGRETNEPRPSPDNAAASLQSCDKCFDSCEMPLASGNFGWHAENSSSKCRWLSRNFPSRVWKFSANHVTFTVHFNTRVLKFLAETSRQRTSLCPTPPKETIPYTILRKSKLIRG